VPEDHDLNITLHKNLTSQVRLFYSDFVSPKGEAETAATRKEGET
jgi:hypothetical protein